MGKKKEETGTVKVRKPKAVIDMEVLRNLVESGNSAKSIMEAMGIKQIASVKNAIFNLSQMDKKFYDVPGLIDAAKRPDAVRVGKTGLKLGLDKIPFKASDVLQIEKGSDWIKFILIQKSENQEEAL